MSGNTLSFFANMQAWQPELVASAAGAFVGAPAAPKEIANLERMINALREELSR